MEETPPLPNHRKTRSKNGCLTCRIRKVKCDERRPICSRCASCTIKCEWLEPGRSWSLRGSSKPVSGRRSQACRRLAPSTSTIEDDGRRPEYSDLKLDPSSITTRNSSLGQIEINNQESPQQSLSIRHIPLANSLQLTTQDQAAFLYIPDSILVLSYGKPWKWSCFSYIYTHIASQYSGVMRSFIAAAMMEHRSQELLSTRDGNGTARSRERAQQLYNTAVSHYSLALKDLSSLLDRIIDSEGRSNDMDALFVMWFLILRFEAYDLDSTGASMVHLDGIRFFLRPYIQGGKKLPYVSQAMLLFTMFLDADSATGNVTSGRLVTDLLAGNDNDFISHENLFRSARASLPKIWGEVYPVSELLDDLENCRPLRLFHKCQMAKLDLLLFARLPKHDQNHAKARELWEHIRNVGEEFADILILAKLVPDSGGKRLMWTVYSATLDFHALQILHLHLYLYLENDSQIQIDSALSQILAIASKALRENTRQIYRCMWSLSVALRMTQGHSDQHWLSAQLERARVLLPNFGVPGMMLEKKS